MQITLRPRSGQWTPDGHLEPHDLVRLNRWFIRLRWLACIVSAAFINVTARILGHLDRQTFWPPAVLVVCLVVANVVFTTMLRQRWLLRYLREIQIGVDLLILTAMLHYSGGIENPLSFAYLFHIIIGGILFPRRECYIFVGIASVLFCSMALAHHYTLLVIPHQEADDYGVLRAGHKPLHVLSLVLLQIVFMALIAFFTTHVMERLRAEESRALADRQRLEHVLQATGAGLLILDEALQPVWLNDRLRTWLDLSEDDPKQESDRLEKWTAGEAGLAARTLRDGEVRVTERQVPHSDSSRFFQVTIAPLTDGDGRVYQVAELAQDITERKAAEAEMAHGGKMAMLGVMAASIAHEVGNPLASISTRLRLLEEQHDAAFLTESLGLLQNQIDRISRVVHGVSLFARPSKHEWIPCDINTTVAEALNAVRLHRLAKQCEIHADLAESVPSTLGLKDQLMHVLLNLGLNALEAMPNGGALTVRTYTDGQHIHITFADTGEGMTEEVRSKVFNAFFSTKDEGMGLGLSIVQNVVRAHRGRIEVESQPGRGTSFTVCLPILTRADHHDGGMGGTVV